MDDDYVWFDLEGNLGSGNNEDELPFVDENKLAVWFISEGTPLYEISFLNEFETLISYMESCGCKEED